MRTTSTLTTDSELTSTPRAGENTGITLEQVECGRTGRMKRMILESIRQVKQYRLDPAWVSAKHLEQRGGPGHLFESRCHLRVSRMTVEVDEENIMPFPLTRRP